MREHPIEGLMSTAMSSIQDMVDVNTIIGDPIETSNNIVIIPISKVCFGFAAGGSEFNEETIDEYNKKEKEEMVQYKLPFGGGSGAGVSINPVAFLVVQEGNVKLLPVNHSSAIDRLLDYVPDLFEKVNDIINKNMKTKEKCDKDKSKEKTKEESTKSTNIVIEKHVPQTKKENNKEENTTYEFEYIENEDELDD